jgi:hypothetical protein
VGIVVLGLAFALGVFIHFQPRDLQPPEDVPRALTIPALYATMGLLALVGAAQRRPAIVVAAGVLCLAGTILSVATIPFGVPGVLLIVLGSRIHAPATWSRAEPIIAAGAVLLVVGAAIALLGMTETRCWRGTGTIADPVYVVVACDDRGGLVGGGQAAGGQTFASGSDSGVLTTRGGLVEAGLLLGALAVVILSGRARGDTVLGSDA